MTRRRRAYERPLLDWVLAAALATGLAFTPLRPLVTAADVTAQRGVMTSVASILGVFASFTTAAIFFYAGADNPSAHRIRARWGRWYSWVLLRALVALLVGAFVSAFASLGVPGDAATIVFFTTVCAALTKLGRILLIVAALLLGQQADDRELPPLARRRERAPR